MLQTKPIPEGRECRHVTCGSVCHREPAISNVRKPLKRSPLNRSIKSKVIKKGKSIPETNAWYLDRAKEMTGICCNCGGSSSARSGVYWKWSIAHIFPKEPNFGFPSVSTHPLNWLELCIQCHTLFDRSLSIASTLKCWPLAADRFIKFENNITENRKFLTLFKEYINAQKPTSVIQD